MSKNHEYNHDPSDWVPMPEADEKRQISADTWDMLMLFAALALIAGWMTKC